MPLMFPCESCGKPVKARSDWVGKETTCLSCGRNVIVPASLPAAAPLQPAPAPPSVAPPLGPLVPAGVWRGVLAVMFGLSVLGYVLGFVELANLRSGQQRAFDLHMLWLSAAVCLAGLAISAPDRPR